MREYAFRELPFVGVTPDGRYDLWTAKPCGHQDTDVDRGEMYGRLTVEVSRQYEMPELIALVLRDMVLAGRFTAVEAGFLAVVARAARAGRMN